MALFRDSQVLQQPEGTSRFKLNVVRDSTDGGKNIDVSEIGNRRIFSNGEPLIGQIPISPSESIVFTGVGKIYHQQDETLTILKDLPCLSFDETYPITGTFRTVRGCERIVYWADGKNPDRFFNLDKADKFQTCNDFSQAPLVGHPTITSTVSASGGKLEYGSYRFVIELLDYTGNTILRSNPTDTVVIGDALNIDSFTADVGGKPATTNSIVLNFTNIDLRAKFLRVIALSKTSGDGVTPQAHISGGDIPITGRTMTYRYVGYNPAAGDTSIPFQDALKTNVVYRVSNDTIQSNNLLIRANIRDGGKDYGSYQQYASKIGTKYLVDNVLPGPDIITEQGDEVKAYGIVYVFSDGTFSPAFHIPGPLATAQQREIISTRFGPGDASSKKPKTFRLTLDVSTRKASGGDRFVSISYFGNTAINTISFKVISGSDSKVLTSNQRSTILTTEIEGRKAPIVVEINVTDSEGAKYFRVIQFSDSFPSQLLTMTTSTENLFSAENLESWKVNNTASKDEVPISSYDSSGTFGVYESSQEYSNPSNYCKDDSFWGSDFYGNPLLGSKVRYHRIPCRTLEPLVADGYVRKIGVYFSNVTYPSTDIVGHFFVSSTYDESNRTIATSGYSVPYNFRDDVGADSKDDTGRYLHYLPNSYDNARPSNALEQNLITLPYLIDGKIAQGRFIKTNGYLTSSYLDNRPKYKKFFKGQEGDLQLFGKHHKVVDFVSSHQYNLIESSVNLLSKTLTDTLPNRSLTSNFNIVKMVDLPVVFDTERANLNYVYVKTGFAPFQFYQQIRYRPLGGTILTATSASDAFEIFDGDSYISQVDITNISRLTKEGISQLSLILLIGLFQLLIDKKQIDVEYELIEGLVFESPYNYNRRFEGTSNCANYYNPRRSIDDVIIRRIADQIDVDGKKDWVIRGSICEEWYGNNPDFNIWDSIKDYFPLAELYDYCSDCLNKYPNRIIYSEVGTQEDSEDSFLVFKPLNYVDIPANGGPIVKLDLVGDKIIVRTMSKSFMLMPNAQELKVGDVSAYLGSGSFLAIPAQEITAGTSGFAGQQSKLSSVMTPYGLVWADAKAGKVFYYNGDGVEEISRFGMYHWFEENMKPGPITYPVIVAYDPLWEHIVLSAKNYVPITDGSFTRVGNKLLIDGNEVSKGSHQLFENRSFTLSFHMSEKRWISFHSYSPDFMYNNGTTMFTAVSSGIYAHNDRQKSAFFYGQEYPVTIEVNYANIQTFQHAAFHYYAQFQQYDADDRVWRAAKDVNFDRAWAYNSTQSSGIVTLVTPDSPFANIGWSTNQKTVVVKDHNSRIAGLRDIGTSGIVESKAWKDRQVEYEGDQGFTDVAPTQVNYDLPEHEQILFRDKYLNIRLSIKNSNYRVLFHQGAGLNNPSNR